MLVSKITPDEVVGVTSKSVDFLIMAGTISKAVERYVRYAGELEKIVEMENVNLKPDILTERTDLYDTFPSNIAENATVVTGTYDKAKDADLDTYDSGEVELDLGLVVSEPVFLVAKISGFNNDNDGAVTLTIQISEDESNWTTISQCTAQAGRWITLQDYLEVSSPFKYIRWRNPTGGGIRTYLFWVIKKSDHGSWVQSSLQAIADMEYFRWQYPLDLYDKIVARLSGSCIYLHNATYELWNGSEFEGGQPAYKLFENADLILKLFSWDQNNSKVGNKLAEHVIESTPASGDYKIQNYGKDIAVIIKGTDYRYRIYDISHVNALPTVISVQR